MPEYVLDPSHPEGVGNTHFWQPNQQTPQPPLLDPFGGDDPASDARGRTSKKARMGGGKTQGSGAGAAPTAHVRGRSASPADSPLEAPISNAIAVATMLTSPDLVDFDVAARTRVLAIEDWGLPPTNAQGCKEWTLFIQETSPDGRIS